MANTLRFKRGLVATIPTAALGEPLFTTDTFDLYIGNGTTNTRFQKYIASGTTSQLLRGDGSLLTMPIVLTSPSTGQVLKYNGTSWVNDSDAGITGSGANGRLAFWNGTNTQTSSAALTFNGTNTLTIDGGTTGYLAGPSGEMLIGEDSSALYIGYGFGVSPAIPINYGSTGTTSHIWRTNTAISMRLHSTGNLVLGGTVSTDNGLRFQVTGDGYFSGSVGIDNATPQSKLVVQNASGTAIPSLGSHGGHFQIQNGSYGLLTGVTTGGNAWMQVQRTDGTPTAYNLILQPTGGNVGIGTTSPTQKLFVSGTGITRVGIENTDNQSTGAGVFMTVKNGASVVGSGTIRIDNVGDMTFWNGTSSDSLKMLLDVNGRLSIGSGAVTSELLQVNGTMKVTGASTFGGNMSLSLNQNASTRLTISNTTSGTSSAAELILSSNAGGGIGALGKLSSTTNVYKILAANNTYLYNDGAGDIAILNEFVSGSIKMAAGSSATAHFTIASTGAATFSSSVRAAGYNSSGGEGYAVINSLSNTVTAIRPTGGGTSIMSTNSNGLHIAVGTEAAGDLILASNNTERIRLSSNGFFSQLNATNPSSNITDSYIQYSADVVAGNAAPHFRTENGAVIKLYQETTAVGNSTISVGGGNSVLDDTEFDGYTLRQIVKALRNQGILA